MMGKLYSKLGGKRQKQLINRKDGKGNSWNVEISEVEVNRQSLKRKRSIETQIKEESIKRRKCECQVKTLKSTTKKQAKVIARLKMGSKENS